MRDKLIALRKELHQHPELSLQESNTAARISAFVKQSNPTKVISQLGGHGLAVCYEFGTAGPNIGIRCELDALPILEENDFVYQSTNKGVSHKCGHDGHMAIVAGLSVWLGEQNLKQGKVTLLFQASEENGKGAAQMLQDDRFRQLDFDYLFALHNIPGEELHKILVMDGGFSAEVISFSVSLTGKESHAAEPDKGLNPSAAIAKIISGLEGLNLSDPKHDDFAVLTPVHVSMGEKNYGISPASGELHYTVRTWSTPKMELLKQNIHKIISDVCEEEGLGHTLDWFEYFPAAANETECNSIIRAAASTLNLKQVERPYPFKFGEDFGWFSKDYKTGMFGMGAGVNTPALHNKDYDFPDELIETGMHVFKQIILQILQ